MASDQLLQELLRLQAEIRELESEIVQIEATQPSSSSYSGRLSDSGYVSVDGVTYKTTGGGVQPSGSYITLSDGSEPGEVVWADYGEPNKAVSFTDIPCANGVNCLDTSFCYSWFECDKCEWCVDNKCVERDPNRVCLSTSECPCPPNEDQHYECLSGRCSLSCTTTEDCPECQVCGDGFCGPGCKSDAECDPNSPEAVGDAKSNSFCVDCECLQPCEPPRFCRVDTDCKTDEYCAERLYRAPNDPAVGAAYECLPGCRSDADCNRDGAQGEFCINHECVRFCDADSDCLQGERCRSSTCQDVGIICTSDASCPEGKYCNSSGRCADGCRTTADCNKPCEPDRACVDACGWDPTCTCTEVYGGENCEGYEWTKLCPRDPLCVENCPPDPNCIQSNNETCVGNTCKVLCVSTTDCGEGYACVDGECRYAKPSGDPTTPPVDDRFGCDCGEVCTQQGMCAQAVCTIDSDCPDCSYCRNGSCVPGCDEKNPCPTGECCGKDGKCHQQCSSDGGCPFPEVCLHGGCCGLACDPVIACLQHTDCPDKMHCTAEGVCEDGCTLDEHCEYGEICYQFDCRVACVDYAQCSDSEQCVDGVCESLPPALCSTDNDCADDEICDRGRCAAGCRGDSDCPSGEVCGSDNKCEFRCISDEQCVALDKGTMCQNGKCSTNTGSGTGGSYGGHNGCEAYEQCNERGICEAIPCATDADCPSGDCLVGGVCGECMFDSQCPGKTICYKDEGAAFNEPGTCSFPCIPEEYCGSDSECPSGHFCCQPNDCNCNDCSSPINTGQNDVGVDVPELRGTCKTGCRNSFECIPGEVCRNNKCYRTCQNCNQLTEECYDGICVYVGFKCVSTDDCESGRYCVDGYCEVDNRCEADADCGQDGHCRNGFCDNVSEEPTYNDPYNQEDITVVGCESCADYCHPEKFICVPHECKAHGDCDCGFCADSGTCGESCRNDSGCINGVCIDGDCLECRSNNDCALLYDTTEMLCVNNKCETPCGGGQLGDCFLGLSYSDPCGLCGDMCPDGSTCRTTDDIESTYEVYDKKLDRTVTRFNKLKRCVKSCTANIDCPDGFTCFSGRCAPPQDRCDDDNDCTDIENGVAGRCIQYQCQEVGDNCFFNSDCSSSEVCVDGKCVKGTCTDTDPCGIGYACVDNQCVFACGVGPLTCSTTGSSGTDYPCPPGYTCTLDAVTKVGTCTRTGYTGGGTMGCPTGTVCFGGGCVKTVPGKLECGDADDCKEGYECKDNLCTFKVEDPDKNSPDIKDNKEPTEKPKPEEKDNCQKINKCCGDDGFCTECGCDEEHPCGLGKCCNDGVCVNYSDHPQTMYGAPNGCTYAPVYCQILDAKDSAIDVEQLGGPDFPGCEWVDNPNPNWEIDGQPQRFKRCWDGKKPNEQQLRKLVENVCFESLKEDCSCSVDSEPDNECMVDTDCSLCQRCVQKYQQADPCCPQDGRFVIPDPYNPDNEPIEISTNWKVWNVCENLYSKNDYRFEEECTCESDDDCTECEYCDLTQGSSSNGGNRGYCVADCDNRCPCGGPLTGDSNPEENPGCKKCKDRYGNRCAVEREVELIPEYWDSTQEVMIPAKKHCECAIDNESDCCERYQSLDDLNRWENGCLYKESEDSNGKITVRQVEYCANWDDGTCAVCTHDSHCDYAESCRNNVCVSQCGSEDGEWQEKNNEDCTCCHEKQCRQIYEAWHESREVHARDETGAKILDEYGLPKKDQQCRPCECTDNGTDCKSWERCDACYKWQRKDRRATGGMSEEELWDKEVEDKAELIRIETEQQSLETRMKETEEQIEELEDAAQESYAQYQSWQSKLDIVTQAELKICNNDNPCPDEMECFKTSYDPPIGENDFYCHGQALAAKYGGYVKLWKDDYDLKITTKVGLQNWLNDAYDRYQANKQKLEGGFKPSEWERVRTCSCCIDGYCRPESDCTYGTCYICLKDVNEYYHAALYQHITDPDKPICLGYVDRYGNPNEDGCHDVEGGTGSVAYTAEEGSCIKYACKDGLEMQQRMGSLQVTRHYEYCTGGIIGCILQGAGPNGPDKVGCMYKNGFKYEADLKDTGLFFGNHTLDYENFIQMSHPLEDKLKAECMWPNRLGHVRGHELPTFFGLIASHPCCQMADLVYECMPDHPNCQIKLETLYEPGDTSVMVKRLKKELRALKDYAIRLYKYYNNINGVIAEYEDLRDAWADRWNESAAVWTEARQVVDNLKNDIQELEDEKEELEARLDELQAFKDEKVQEFQVANDDLMALVDERKALEEQLVPLEEERTLTYDNYTSAQGSWSIMAGQYQTLYDEIEVDRQTLLTLDPQTVQYAELEQQIQIKESDLSELQSDRDELLNEYQSNFDSYTDLTKQKEELEAQIEELNTQIAAQQESWYDYNIAAGTAIGNYEDCAVSIGETTQALINKNNQLEIAESNLENIGEIASLYSCEWCDFNDTGCLVGTVKSCSYTPGYNEEMYDFYIEQIKKLREAASDVCACGSECLEDLNCFNRDENQGVGSFFCEPCPPARSSNDVALKLGCIETKPTAWPAFDADGREPGFVCKKVDKKCEKSKDCDTQNDFYCSGGSCIKCTIEDGDIVSCDSGNTQKEATGELEDVVKAMFEKYDVILELIENDGLPDKPEKVNRPSTEGDLAPKTLEQLREMYQAAKEYDEQQSGKKWYP